VKALRLQSEERGH